MTSFFRNMTLLPRNPIKLLSSFTAGKHEGVRVGKAQELRTILKRKFPNAFNVEVTDISGGCGKLFKIYVESEDFRGLSTLKQHRAVTGALREQIKHFHGVRIETKVPSPSQIMPPLRE